MTGATIWLVGMMGAGKSAVGAALARRLGRRFVDSDVLVERAAGQRIAEIFAREGEAAFRRRERETLERLAGRPLVVALGGGAIAQPGALERLRASGRVVHLRARPETLLARIGDASSRPLLAGLDRAARLARLRALLRERAPAYRGAAFTVDTDDVSPDCVAARIERELAGEGMSESETSTGAGVLHTVKVNAPGGRYPIFIGHQTLACVGAEVARHTNAKTAVLVSVPAVRRRYAAPVVRSLRAAGLRAAVLEVPDGDATKNLRQVARLYDALLDLGADRDAVVVALGGGMVGDLAGFVAATYLRGVAFVQVPTTILAMTDSSIGGKVGVNLPRGKNLVGAFHQPALVHTDTAVLESLPARQRAAGLAEVIKAGAIRDAAFFERLERDIERVHALEPAALVPAIRRACEIKAEVVSRDEREADLRMLLNFGHTLAHAVEHLSHYRRILHGEAVAMGMVFAARRSEALELSPPGTADRIAALCARIGLPTALPDFERKAYLAALRVDKKRRDRRVRFVALRGIGRAETVPLTPAEILPAGALPARLAATARRGRRKGGAR